MYCSLMAGSIGKGSACQSQRVDSNLPYIFFIRDHYIIPAHLVESDIVCIFVVLNNDDMKNFLTALFVGYVVVGVYKAVTKKG